MKLHVTIASSSQKISKSRKVTGGIVTSLLAAVDIVNAGNPEHWDKICGVPWKNVKLTGKRPKYKAALFVSRNGETTVVLYKKGNLPPELIISSADMNARTRSLKSAATNSMAERILFNASYAIGTMFGLPAANFATMICETGNGEENTSND